MKLSASIAQVWLCLVLGATPEGLIQSSHPEPRCKSQGQAEGQLEQGQPLAGSSKLALLLLH